MDKLSVPNNSDNSMIKTDDELIDTGVKAAINKNLKPAITEQVYPGHFCICADCLGFGMENTWPGLDSWEAAGAYLLLGYKRLVLDYFDFVQAAQRPDGNIPFAIFPPEGVKDSLTDHLQGLKYPEDIYTYQPQPRAGQPESVNMSPRKWIGLFDHWQQKENPFIPQQTDYFPSTAVLFRRKRKRKVNGPLVDPRGTV